LTLYSEEIGTAFAIHGPIGVIRRCDRTIADLKNDPAAACTPPQHSKAPVPLSDIERGYTAPGDAVLRFIVGIERSKLAWLVKFRMIRSDQQDDLLAIMTGLKCLGQPPSISRIA
jgi:hypothetical protein